LRLVVISSRFPFPLIKGDKLRLYHQIKILSTVWEICLVSISENDVSNEDKAELEKFCSEVHIFTLSKWKRTAGLSLNFNKQTPFQVRYFYDKQIHTSLQGIVNQFKPDVAYFQLIRTALYAEGLSVPCILDYMDSFSTIAKRDAELSSGIRKYAFETEAKRLKIFERDIADKFVGKTVISENDKKLLDIPDLKVISNGVDVNHFKSSNEIKEFDLCFVGNLGYSPNQRAVDILVKKIMPRLLFKKPNATLLIAGARPPNKIKSLSSPNISIMADLVDIRKAYSLSRVFIAPIFSGAGQQNKILEAMSMGLPCVTSSIVNSSISASSDQIKIGFSIDDFVKYSIELLYDKNAYLEQQSNALTLVKSNYSWSSQVNKLDQYLRSFL